MNPPFDPKAEEDGYYDPRLQCEWKAWVRVGHQTLHLHLPEGNYVHMPACIKIAKAVMPNVKHIICFCAGEPDISYALYNGEWKVDRMWGMLGAGTSLEKLKRDGRL